MTYGGRLHVLLGRFRLPGGSEWGVNEGHLTTLYGHVKKQIVLPPKLREAALRNCHSVYGYCWTLWVHEESKTEASQRVVCVPGMHRDVEDITKICDVCANATVYSGAS